jgi:hypothetical protein
MQLVDANPNAQASTTQPLAEKVNYFIGNNPGDWITNVPTAAQVSYSNVWQGIDLQYTDATQQQLEYTFVVNPGADPNQVRLTFPGATGLSLDSQGNLVLQTPTGNLVQQAPVLYQLNADGSHSAVSGNFVLEGNGQVGFQVGAYDTGKALYIDPVLSYSSYWGGSGAVTGNAVTTDANGPVFTGQTPDPNNSSNTDAYVTQVNSAGNAVTFVDYVGGTGTTSANAIAVDLNGTTFNGIAIAGSTTASNLPNVNGSQSSLSGSEDGFLAEVSPSGSSINFSTYYGGSAAQSIQGVASDNSGDLWVTGWTTSTDLPLNNPYAFQTSASGGTDAFLSEFTSGTLNIGTYLGGSGNDQGNAVAIPNYGTSPDVYVAGTTASTNFPTTTSGWQTALQGSSDAFVVAFAPFSGSLSQEDAGTLVGGSSGATTGQALAFDANGNVYLAGSTTSPNLPATQGAFQTTLKGTQNAYVVELDAGLDTPAYVTYLGGSGSDSGNAIAVDNGGSEDYANGFIYVAGSTTSTDFPQLEALPAGGGGSGDGFVTALDPGGCCGSLIYSTYLGPSEAVNGLALDGTGTGQVLVAGTTSSSNFPTVNPFQSSLQGSSNAFLALVTQSLSITAPLDQSNQEGDTVSLQVQGRDAGGTGYYGSSGLPADLTIDTNTGLISGTLDYYDAETDGGNYNVTITLYDADGASVSTNFNWHVSDSQPPPVLNSPGDQDDLEGDAVALPLGATSADGSAITYSATGLPTGLSIDPNTGLISGVIASTDGGSSPYNVSVTATNDGGPTTVNFNWTVSDVQINGVAEQSNLLGDSVAVPTYAWDTSGDGISYSASGLPPGLSINSSSGVISGVVSSSASLTTPYSVTVTATAGNDKASTSFNWSIAALAIDDPGDQTNTEGDVVALPLSASENNADAVYTWSATGLPSGLAINPNTGVIAGTIAAGDANDSPYAVTVTAGDGTNTATDNFNWYVTHIQLTTPDTQYSAEGSAASLQVQASDPDNDTLTYSATGLPPGLSINATTGLISGTIASTAGGETPYTPAVTVSDSTHSTSASFDWYVADNGIAITDPGTQSNAEGDSVSLPISATDPNGDSMAWSASGLPDGLSIDPNTGIISGTVSQGDAANGGAYSVTVYADDLDGYQGSTSFTWNISHTDTTPVVTNPGEQFDNVGDAVALPVVAEDGDGDTLSYSATGLPAGLSISSSTGVISGSVTAAPGTYAVAVSASDGTYQDTADFNWVVDGSVVSLSAPADQTNTEGDTVSLQLAATDALQNPLTYAVDGLPEGLSVNTSTGLISGTVDSGDSSGGADGWYAVTAEATDSSGYSAVQEFNWQVLAATPAPQVSDPGTQINAAGDVVDLPVQATDPQDLTLSYSATGLPGGLSIDPTTGVISGIVAGNAAGTYASSVTVSDGTYQATTNFTWDATNQAVTLTNPGTQSGTAGGTASLPIEASDPQHLALTYSAVGLPEGLSINATTGLISGTIASTAGGQYQATVLAADSAGNSGRVVFTWNVAYVAQTPDLGNPGDQVDAAGDAVSLQLDAVEPNGDAITYGASGLPAGLTIDPTTGLISGTIAATAGSSSPYVVTATAADGTLQASATFNWYVTSGAVTVVNPGDQTNAEGDTVSLQVSASDALNSALSYSATGLPGGLTISTSTGMISGTISSGNAADGPYTVLVTAADAQGYSASQQLNWNVNPASVVPVLTNPGAQSNTEGDQVSLQVQASDVLGEPLAWTASGLPPGLMIDPTSGLIEGTVSYADAEVSGGSYTVVVSVNDGLGNTASTNFAWTVANQDQAPWLSNPTLQDNAVGQAVSLQLEAIDQESTPLTYSATGLPPGLTLNATTGVIGGTLTTAGSYTVTASASDGVLRSTQSFGWNVVAAGSVAPQVILAINYSTEDWDHVLLMNPDQPVPMEVTLEDAACGVQQVQLSVPSGMSTLSKTVVNLVNGGSVLVWLTPLVASTVADNVAVNALMANLLVGNAVGMNEKVTIPKVIENLDTPTGMKPRIPPRRTTPEIFYLSAVPPPDTILIKVVMPDPVWASRYGEAYFAPYNNRVVLNDETNMVDLVGEYQTASPQYAGNLSLEVVVTTPRSKRFIQGETKTDGFSVAAIPYSIETGEPTKGEGKVPGAGYPFWGAIYPVTVVSDSGKQADLSKVKVSEYVHFGEHTGLWATNESDPLVRWNPATTPSSRLSDDNGVYLNPGPLSTRADMVMDLEQDIDRADARGGSRLVNQQVVIFSEGRTGVPATPNTGADAMTVLRSGFVITAVGVHQGNRYYIAVTRQPENIAVSPQVLIDRMPTVLPERYAYHGNVLGSKILDDISMP